MSFIDCQLKDVVELAYGKSLPERSRKNGVIPVYGSGGIGGYHSIPLVKGPGIVVGRKGTVGSVFYEKNDFFPIDTVYFVRADTSKISLEYSYYLLKNLPLSSLNTDAAVPGLNRDRAYALPIRLPRVAQQERIVHVLKQYDDLIENNRRRLELLEESARLLYQEWFVHLRFPGHEQVRIIDGVPEGWERKPLKHIATLHYGKALKAETRVPGPYPVYGSSGEVGTHEKALTQGPAIVLGRKGNVGSVYWVSTDFHPIDTVYFISREQSSLFLYQALQHVHFINTDVAVPGLNRDMAYSRELLIPDDKNHLLFLAEAQPIQDQINKLQTYNQKLTQARDLLLPKLMSGELTL